MASHFLTVTTSMSCPHGGTITPSTSNTRVKAAGDFVLRFTDTFTVGGCPYVRGTVPNPCVRVQWDVHAQRHASHGDLSLTEESIGLCLDGSGGTQGIAVISSTQSRGAGS
jgi:hypothetical protein